MSKGGAGRSRIVARVSLVRLILILPCLALVVPMRTVAAPSTTTIATATPTPAPTPEQPPDAGTGLAIYREHCAACHGPLGRGGGEMADRLPAEPPSFADPEAMRGLTPDQAYDIVTNGRLDKLMPPWRDKLSTQQRWDAVYGALSFYYTPARMVRGRDAWQAHCAACHAGGLQTGANPASGANSVSGAEHASPDHAGMAADPASMAARSQADLFWVARDRRLGEHSELTGISDDDLWAALDYARAAAFRPLPFESLSLDGAVTGQVSSGTEGAASAAGTTIAAVPFGDGMGGELTDGETTASGAASGIVPGDPVTATVGASGTYTLTSLLAGPGIGYRIVASYAGADYIHPEELRFDAGGSVPARVDFEVFEPSVEAPISARRAEIAISPLPEEGLLDVAEAWVLRNDTDRTRVAGPGGATVRIDLLPGAFDIGIDDPRVRASAALTDTTLSSRAAIPPGDYPVMLRYSVPYESETVDIDRVLDLPAEALNLSVIGAGATIQSTDLGAAETVNHAGQVITRAGAQALAEGRSIRARIAGLPPPQVKAQVPAVMRPLAAPAISQSALAGAMLAIALAGALLVFAYPILAARRDPVRYAVRLADERGRLVREIAELDRRRAAGAVDATTHARQRAALLDRALALARAADETAGRGPPTEENNA